MSELQVIESALKQAARRRRWDQALRGLSRGLLAGGVVLLLTIAAYKLFPFPNRIVFAVGWAALGCGLVGLAVGGWRKPSLAAMAQWVDDRKALKERLSTALEVGG